PELISEQGQCRQPQRTEPPSRPPIRLNRERRAGDILAPYTIRAAHHQFQRVRAGRKTRDKDLRLSAFMPLLTQARETPLESDVLVVEECQGGESRYQCVGRWRDRRSLTGCVLFPTEAKGHEGRRRRRNCHGAFRGAKAGEPATGANPYAAIGIGIKRI